MHSPAQELIWGRGLSNYQQVKMAEISLWIPPAQWDRLLAVDNELARWHEFDAICRGFEARWTTMNDQRAHSYDSPMYGSSRVDRYHAHMAEHWGCPGIFACRDFNGKDPAGGVAIERGAPKPECVYCGKPLGAKQIADGRDSHYSCWRGNQ